MYRTKGRRVQQHPPFQKVPQVSDQKVLEKEGTPRLDSVRLPVVYGLPGV